MPKKIKIIKSRNICKKITVFVPQIAIQPMTRLKGILKASSLFILLIIRLFDIRVIIIHP